LYGEKRCIADAIQDPEKQQLAQKHLLYIKVCQVLRRKERGVRREV